MLHVQAERNNADTPTFQDDNFKLYEAKSVCGEHDATLGHWQHPSIPQKTLTLLETDSEKQK